LYPVWAARSHSCPGIPQESHRTQTHVPLLLLEKEEEGDEGEEDNDYNHHEGLRERVQEEIEKEDGWMVDGRSRREPGHRYSAVGRGSSTTTTMK